MELNKSAMYDEFNRELILLSQGSNGNYKLWATSPNSDDKEKCFQFAVYLRGSKHFKEAYEVSKYLTEVSPSLKSYNIYLSSTYDLLKQNSILVDIQTLKKAFDAAWNFYKEEGFEPNITSTLLKCSNLLIEKGLDSTDNFYKIYNHYTGSEKNENSYIIVQYYNRLIAEGRRQDVVNSYSQLSPKLQKNPNINRLLKKCQQSSPLKMPLQSSWGEYKKAQKLTIISNSDHVTKIRSLLERFSIETDLVDIHSENLVENLNRATFMSTTSVFLISEIADICITDTFKWAFVLGYCVHKFSKNNIVLFTYSQVGNSENQFYDYLTSFDLVSIKEDLDIITNLGDRHIISG